MRVMVDSGEEIVVLVCGGRAYKDKARVWKELDSLDAARPIKVVIEGGAEGADKWARAWAKSRNRGSLTFRADWKAYGKAAGPIRNQKQLDEGQPHVVLAFPGGTGTADIVSRAVSASMRRHGMTVVVFQ